MEMNEPYPTEVTQLINAFVDRIEQVLLSRGTPRSERTNICQEVETQIQMMIERRMESGAELNIDLVKGIIESMDPPESYAPVINPVAEPTIEPVLQTDATQQASKNADSKPWSKPPFVDYLQKLLDRPKRTTPALDWVAICGLAAIFFGLFLVVAGPGRGDDAAIIGLMVILAGVAASCLSFWRIRHSNGLLTGQRIASMGILMTPLLLINAFLIAVLFATPFGIILGVLTVIAALIYGNYYVLRRAMSWLASYSVRVPNADTTNTQVSPDNAVLSGVAD